MIILRYLNPPNLVTYIGLLLALSAIMLGWNGYMGFAMISFMGAGLCDLFDGQLARQMDLSDTERRFGQNLDSLNDTVSFGVVPILLLYSVFQSVWLYPVMAIYLIAVLTRLAHFDVVGTVQKGKGSYYSGLPVTTSALVIPLFAWILRFSGAFYLSLLCLTLLALAYFYVSELPVPKPQGAAYLVFPVLMLTMSLLWVMWP